MVLMVAKKKNTSKNISHTWARKLKILKSCLKLHNRETSPLTIFYFLHDSAPRSVIIFITMSIWGPSLTNHFQLQKQSLVWVVLLSNQVSIEKCITGISFSFIALWSVKVISITTKYCEHTGHSWGLPFSNQNQTTSCSSSAKNKNYIYVNIQAPDSRYSMKARWKQLFYVILLPSKRKLRIRWQKTCKSENWEPNSILFLSTYHLHLQDSQLSSCHNKIGWQRVLPTNRPKMGQFMIWQHNETFLK